MELTNEFTVPVPVEHAWAVLTDVERIAPCMPGTTLDAVEGDEYRGTVKVKVGPITAQYRGAAHFVERDDATHRAVLRAEGRESRGQGNAAATITATVTPDGAGAAVKVVTDLTITGKVAQFGRGVLADVSARLIQQFADCLSNDLASAGALQAAADVEARGDTPAASAGGAPRPAPAPAQPVNLVATAGAPVAKRAAPFVALVFLVYWLTRRRRKARRTS
jgi:carbon monoxide dehydrogenase subunit G